MRLKERCTYPARAVFSDRPSSPTHVFWPWHGHISAKATGATNEWPGALWEAAQHSGKVCLCPGTIRRAKPCRVTSPIRPYSEAIKLATQKIAQPYAGRLRHSIWQSDHTAPGAKLSRRRLSGFGRMMRPRTKIKDAYLRLLLRQHPGWAQAEASRATSSDLCLHKETLELVRSRATLGFGATSFWAAKKMPGSPSRTVRATGSEPPGGALRFVLPFSRW